MLTTTDILRRLRRAVCLAVLCTVSVGIEPVFAQRGPLELWHVLETSTLVEDLAADFATRNGKQIEVLPFNTETVKGDLLLSAMSDQLPDAILIPSDFLGLHRNFRLRQIDHDWIAPSTSEQVVETVTVDGALYGVPILAGNFLMLYANRELVANPATSWQELAAQRQQVEARGARLIVWNYLAPYWFAPFLGAYSGHLVNAGRPDLDTTAMVSALGFYHDLVGRGLVDPNCDYACTTDEFAAGRAAYAINGDWAFHNLHEALGDKLDVVPLPRIGDLPMIPLSSTYALAFPDGPRANANTETLRHLALHLQSIEMQRLIFNGFQHIPVNEDVREEIARLAPTPATRMVAMQPNSTTMPSDLAVAFIWTAMERGIRQMTDGVVDPRHVASQMQIEANDALDQHLERQR